MQIISQKDINVMFWGAMILWAIIIAGGYITWLAKACKSARLYGVW